MNVSGVRAAGSSFGCMYGPRWMQRENVMKDLLVPCARIAVALGGAQSFSGDNGFGVVKSYVASGERS